MALLGWIDSQQTLAWWLSAVSVLSVLLFIGTLVAIPIVIARIPADYFVRRSVPAWWGQHPVLHGLLVGVKNMLGGVLLIAGIAMLVLPGQGLVTILAAIFLLDFPRKRKLELWLMRRRLIRRAVDWIRSRRHKPPLQIPDGTGGASQ